MSSILGKMKATFDSIKAKIESKIPAPIKNSSVYEFASDAIGKGKQTAENAANFIKNRLNFGRYESAQ
jgi:hypothetical protein